MRNKYPGRCFLCGKEVPKGTGYFQKVRKDTRHLSSNHWVLRCKSCVGKGNNPQSH